MAIFVPNQIFYVLLSATLVFYGLLSDKKNQRVQKNLFFWGIVSFIAVAAVCSILNYIVYRRELSFQKTSETSKEKENFIINNQKIIVKKNLHEKFKEEYSSINENLKKKSNWRDFMYAISMVAPSYLLINYVEFILLPLICLNENYNPANLILLGRIFSQEKKIFERLKNYPYYFSAKKRLNLLLKKEERDDQESRVIIDEKIKKIELKNVSFSYPGKKEQVLNEFSYIFEIGKINKLVGKNGFGKSTIVEIIMGLNKISDGDVIVNDNYSLKDINLKN
jgi:ABC-type multidrug transport system fused ATPase/permease subunit